MQMGFYLDQTRCIGCYTCTVACKDWHDIPAGLVNWRWIDVVENGKYPNLFVAYLPLSCLHCAEPACASACPVNAIYKRTEDGIVLVDQESCLGKEECSLCLDACPYKAPQFSAENNAKMEKCDFCIDRLSENKQPICIASCPMWALDCGPLNELKTKYGDVRETTGFNYEEALEPSIIFKAKTGCSKFISRFSHSQNLIS